MKESTFEFEINQETVPVETGSDNSEEDIKSNTNVLPNSSNFSKSVREMLGSLMKSRNSIKITRDNSGRAKTSSVPIQVLGADRIKINDKVYDITAEKNKALSYTGINGKTMEN